MGDKEYTYNFMVKAIHYLSDETCIEMIKSGADPFFKLSKGLSGYDYAKKKKKKKLVDYMKSLK